MTYYHVVSLAKLHEQKLMNRQSDLKKLPSKSTTSFMPRSSSIKSSYFLPNAKTTTQASLPSKQL